MGLLGLTPNSLYDLTFREFGNAVRGRYDFNELQRRSDWERTRWQTALLLNVHTKKGSKLTATDLGTFPWEEEQDKQKKIQQGWSMLKAMATKDNGEIR